MTGPSFMATDTMAKRLQFLKELVPGLARVAVLKNSVTPIHTLYWQTIEPAAQQLALELQALEIRTPEDFEAAFAAAKRGNAQALLAFDDALTFDIAYRPRIVALAAASRLPALYGFREFPDDGGLMSYGTNMISHFRHAAKYVDKILKGALPRQTRAWPRRQLGSRSDSGHEINQPVQRRFVPDTPCFSPNIRSYETWLQDRWDEWATPAGVADLRSRRPAISHLQLRIADVDHGRARAQGRKRRACCRA